MATRVANIATAVIAMTVDPKRELDWPFSSIVI
jgi:hypothetical protein